MLKCAVSIFVAIVAMGECCWNWYAHVHSVDAMSRCTQAVNNIQTHCPPALNHHRPDQA